QAPAVHAVGALRHRFEGSDAPERQGRRLTGDHVPVRAMVLTRPKRPLELREVPDPRPATDQALLRVLACGVCRTDLHLADGELDAALPVIPGREVLGGALA